MPKKASGRKKGIQRSIPRHRVGGSKKTPEGNRGVRDETEDGERRSNYFFSYGLKCFESTFALSRKFHLIGFAHTSCGQYVLSNRKDQILHLIAIGLYLAFSIRNTLQTISVLKYEDLGVKSFLCVCLAAIYVLPILISLGVVLRPKETVDVLNSWSYVSTAIQSGAEFHPLHDMSASLKVISAFCCCYVITTSAAIISIVVSNLPLCVVPTLERQGWIPEGLLPRFAWQILFAPVEWILYLPPMLVAPMGGCVLFMGNGAIQIYMEPLQAVRVKCLESRQKLERMYVKLELFNRIFQVWVRYFFPTWLLSFAGSVIITLFVALRFTELPFFLYINFPNSAITMLMIIFWQSLDMFRVTRESEDILGVLLQHQAPYLRGKTRKERVEVMKRAKALRLVTFPLADCEFSLSVPVNTCTWEEILNQVVFLMSL